MQLIVFKTKDTTSRYRLSLPRQLRQTSINCPATQTTPVDIMKKSTSSEKQATNSTPELDPSFGTRGVAYIFHPLNPSRRLDVQLVVADPNTSTHQLIYAACRGYKDFVFEFYLVRLLEDGEIDRSFGENGYATLPVISSTPAGPRELIFFSGSGAITGISEVRFINWWVPGATRLKSSGLLDSSFLVDGSRYYQPPFLSKSSNTMANTEKTDINDTPWLDLRALVEANLVTQSNIQPDGKMVFLARYRQYPDGYALGAYMARINLNGIPDETFGRYGYVKIEDPAEPEFLIDARIYDSDRRGGMVVFSNRRGTGILLRYDAEGSLDQSFGNGGIVVIDDSALGGKALALKALDDGAIIIAFEFDGWRDDPPYLYFYPAVIKLLRDGSRDPDFNNGDPLKFDDLAPDAKLATYSMTLDAGNRIVLSGRVLDGPMHERGFLTRLMPNGTRDTDFGVNGLAIRQDMIHLSSASIQNGTKILSTSQVAGYESIVRFIA
jgi:uncharacterized delta-60 repeat protein